MNVRLLVLAALSAVAVGCGYQSHAIPSTPYDVSFPRGAVIDESTRVDPQGFRVSWAVSGMNRDGVLMAWAMTPRDGESVEPGDHTAPLVEALQAAVPRGCTGRPPTAVRVDSLDGQDLSFACPRGSLHARVLGGPAGIFCLLSAATHEAGLGEMGPDPVFMGSLAPHTPSPSARVVPSPTINTRFIEPLINRLL